MERDERPQRAGDVHGQDPASAGDRSGQLGDHANVDRAHPEVKRSGSSRSTAIAFAVAMACAALMYAAIVLGIINFGG